jgi:ADP-ribose pyrophosphatase YjhB (NUDIX family)
MSIAVPKWLEWAREIQAIAQIGLTYSTNDFDIGRYHRLIEIAAEIVTSQSSLDASQVVQSFQMQEGYATPKVDVRAAVLQEGKILLVQEKVDGCWSMPGGWADVGELPSVVAAREAREESGFIVRPEKLVGVYDANHIEPLQFFHAYKLVFLCSLLGGQPTPSSETLAVDFFPFDALPPLSELRTSLRMLAEVQAHSQDPSRPTFFE